MSDKTTEAKKEVEGETAQVNFTEILQSKITLSDGTPEFLFSRGPKYNEKLWPIQCHLCRVGYMINEKKLLAHLHSEKHTTRVSEPPPDAELFRKPYQQLYSDRMRLMNPIKIMPGEIIEDVTTDHADRLMPCKHYNWDGVSAEPENDELNKDIISDYNETGVPILGLCYGFKMFSLDKDVVYYCALCNISLGEHNAYQHFVGLNSDHVNQYMNLHFENLVSRIQKLIDNKIKKADKEKWTNNIVRKIYGKLEVWKGFRKMHAIDGKLFEENRQKYLPKARKLLHYSENAVYFTDTELLEFIEECQQGNFLPEHPERLPNQKTTPPKGLAELNLPQNEQRKRKSDSKNDGSAPDKKASNDSNKPKTVTKLNESPDNWRKYRNLVERALKSLNDEYGRFVDMSENHPQYAVQWTRFWRRRCMELEDDNIDVNQYDFMPEWNRFWIRYLEDCYRSDVDKCKFEIRKSLRLPYRTRTPDPIGRRRDNNSNNNNSRNNSSMSTDVGFKNQNGGNNGNGGFNNRSGSTNNNGENRSTGDANNRNTNNNTRNENVNNQRPMPLMGILPIAPEPEQEPEIEILNEPLSVLSVLRLLTALEDQLGSLGPTALQLLSKAIFYEKESNASANELLNETEYFTLFITALEKLKGLKFAGIVPQIKKNAVNKAIENLDSILNLFEEYKRRNPDRNVQTVSNPQIDVNPTVAVANVDNDMRGRNSSNNSMSGRNVDNSNEQRQNLETKGHGEFSDNLDYMRRGNSNNNRSGGGNSDNMRSRFSDNNQGDGEVFMRRGNNDNMRSRDSGNMRSGNSYSGSGGGGDDNNANKNVLDKWRVGNYGAGNKNADRNQSLQSGGNDNSNKYGGRGGGSNNSGNSSNWQIGSARDNQDYGNRGANTNMTGFDNNAGNRGTGSRATENWRSSSVVSSGSNTNKANDGQMRNSSNNYRSNNDDRQFENYQSDNNRGNNKYTSTTSSNNYSSVQNNNNDNFNYTRRYDNQSDNNANRSQQVNNRNQNYNTSIWNTGGGGGQIQNNDSFDDLKLSAGNLMNNISGLNMNKQQRGLNNPRDLMQSNQQQQFNSGGNNSSFNVSSYGYDTQARGNTTNVGGNQQFSNNSGGFNNNRRY